MIALSARWVLFVSVVGTVFFLGCQENRRSVPSSMVHEIEQVRRRTVPSGGSLLRVSEPVRSDSSVRASWEIQAASDNRAYFRSLKNQLGPEYHVTSETSSGITFVKQREGDAYTVGIRSKGAVSDSVFEAAFVAQPD